MIKWLNISFLVLALAFSVDARAQYDAAFAHYFDMETSFNPAAVGKESKLNFTGAYAMDLAGFEHNPNTMYAAADMPFIFMNGTHGAGLQFINDKLGLFNHMRISLQYAKKQKLFGGTLSVGVQAGLLSEKFDGSELDLNDASDPAFASSQIEGNSADISAGIYYQHGRWYVGASALHLTAPTVELGEKNELKVDRSYWLTAGYTFKMRNPFISFKASALGRTDLTAYRADVTGRLMYNNDTKHFYAGLSYSPTNSVTVLVGGEVQGITLGYSYEVYTSAINPGNGSHELFVGYQTDINLVKKGKNLHKSVRIL